MRLLAVAALVAVLGAACGGSADPVAGIDDADVLSPCAPASDGETTTLVEATGARPPVQDMEAAIGDNPDAQFIVEQHERDGVSREDAVHAMYAQVVGDRLLAEARRLPGFVAGAYAQPLEGVPFRLSFSGAVPDEFDPAAHDLGSFGLEVTTGAAGFDADAFTAAYEAAREVGIRVVSGSGDETTGTGRIEVIDATPQQVTAWEAAVDDPSRWCLVRAPRTVPCSEDVIADARARADRQGEVIPHGGEDTAPTAEQAETIRRSYLGLPLDQATDKASQEAREVRVVIEDGVQLGRDGDLVPGRINLTVCQSTVVDAEVEAITTE